MIRSAPRSAAFVIGTVSITPPSTRCIPSTATGG